jgi:hypothetical protein
MLELNWIGLDSKWKIYHLNHLVCQLRPFIATHNER